MYIYILERLVPHISEASPSSSTYIYIYRARFLIYFLRRLWSQFGFVTVRSDSFFFYFAFYVCTFVRYYFGFRTVLLRIICSRSSNSDSSRSSSNSEVPPRIIWHGMAVMLFVIIFILFLFYYFLFHSLRFFICLRYITTIKFLHFYYTSAKLWMKSKKKEKERVRSRETE